MGYVLAVSWLLTLLATCAAALVLITGEASATGSPQQAAAAAIAVAVAIIPYVFTRSIEAINAALQRRD